MVNTIIDNDLLVTELLSMSSTEKREFEEEIVKLITQDDKAMIDDLHKILIGDYEPEVRFRAFFAIATHHRRHSDITEFKKIVDRHISSFKEFKLHYHVYALLHKSFHTSEGITESIRYNKIAGELLPDHVGILHGFSESVATALDENIMISDEDIEKAMDYILYVTRASGHYPKFHSTKGRLLAHKKKFTEAKTALLHAIDLEDSSARDYSLRVNEYKNILSQIRTMELYESVRKEIVDAKTTVVEAESSVQSIVKTTEGKMENMKQQNIQMLAFFTAIISFVIGSINIISNQNSFPQAAMLILVLAGALVIANVAFSVLLSNLHHNHKKHILVALFGFSLIAT